LFVVLCLLFGRGSLGWCGFRVLVFRIRTLGILRLFSLVTILRFLVLVLVLVVLAVIRISFLRVLLFELIRISLFFWRNDIDER
jgi:hypothetical protein